MADLRQRCLERRAAHSGDPRERLAWLTERYRSGVVGEHGLLFASYLGDVAARQMLIALGRRRAVTKHVLSSDWPASDWVHAMPGLWGEDGTEYWGQDFKFLVEVCQRVGAALARLAVPHLDDARRSLGQQAVHHMDAWIADRREADRLATLERVERLIRGVRHVKWLRWIRVRTADEAAWALDQASTPAQWPNTHVNAMPSRAAGRLASILGEDELRRSLAAALMPWALSQGRGLASEPLRRW